MRSLDHDDTEPLPPPIREAQKPRPVPGRPNWFYGPKDVPYYVEPERKQDTPMMMRSGLSPAVLHAAAAVLRFRGAH
jgi:hypothetical protein